MIGRYLDLLPPGARQRIEAASAAAWTTRAYADGAGRRCLLGHAENWGWDGRRPHARHIDWDVVQLRRAVGDDLLNYPSLLAQRFDRLCDRWGIDAIVGLVRARCAGTSVEAGPVLARTARARRSGARRRPLALPRRAVRRA